LRFPTGWVNCYKKCTFSGLPSLSDVGTLTLLALNSYYCSTY
jgi:hypothetical protein